MKDKRVKSTLTFGPLLSTVQSEFKVYLHKDFLPFKSSKGEDYHVSPFVLCLKVSPNYLLIDFFRHTQDTMKVGRPGNGKVQLTEVL